jgi:hypothetical protein
MFSRCKPLFVDEVFYHCMDKLQTYMGKLGPGLGLKHKT